MSMERIECDVLIAGSGAGGLAAALTAAHHGLNAIVAEKESCFGGTTAYSAGVVWIPNNTHAQREGLGDSPEAALQYLQSEVGALLDRPKAEAYLKNCVPMLDFFEQNTLARFTLMKTWADYHPSKPGAALGGRPLLPEPFDGRLLGDQFNNLRPPLSTTMIFGGMSVSRDDIPHLFNVTRSLRSAIYVAGLFARYARDRLSYSRGTAIANGNALVARLVKSMMDRGIPLWLSSPLTRLSVVDGRVVGAVVRRESRDVEVSARRGVVLACGGFPRNQEMLRDYFPHVAAGKIHVPLTPSGNNGDGIRAAQKIGAAFIGEAEQPAAWTPVSLVPQKDGSTVPFPHFIDRCKPGYIAVDRGGRRFANEADSYHDFVPHMLRACKNDAQAECYLICDHRAIRRYGMGAVPPSPLPLAPHLSSGYLKRADTPQALAQVLGLNSEGLLKTLENYNRHAERGEDPQFGKGTNAYHRFGGDPLQKPNPNIAPIVNAPFYAVRLVPSDLGTFLGLAADAQARVLDINEQPIPGLYAAGNDMASFMGGTYPGAGITIGPAMTFGWIAARHMAGIET